MIIALIVVMSLPVVFAVAFYVGLCLAAQDDDSGPDRDSRGED